MLNPLGEAIKDRTFSSEFSRKSSPLTASSGEVNESVEDWTVWYSWTTWFLASFLDDELGLDSFPECVWNSPDGVLLVDGCLMNLGGTHTSSLTCESAFRIGSK